MPLINSIEVANFMNRERRTPFEPTWPHCVFPLLGLNSIINVANGRGKTTIVKLVLYLLAGQKRKIDEMRSMHFAPRASGSYTHLRVQMIMDTEEAAGMDLFSGTPLGKQMVFGVYGRSGDNEEYKLYSYIGSLEDCPVHHANTDYSKKVNLISDKEFEAKLGAVPYKFPSSARDSTAESWKAYVEKWFDLASIEQQVAYQAKAGGEGSTTYFEVPGKGAEFASNVFYERLAPELLHDVMGGFGEEDEKKIEDTIHEKTRQVIHARLRNAETAKALEQTGRVLKEMQYVCDMADDMSQSATLFQEYRNDISLELGMLKDAIIDRPFPGLPAQPPDESADVAQFIVLCDGKPYLSDRGVGFFSGEEPKVINRRAERNSVMTSQVENSHLIEITCHQKNTDRDERGRSTKYYCIECSSQLLANTDNFLPEWDRDSAVAMLKCVFEWASSHADTNPAREAKREHDEKFELKKTELDSTNNELTGLSNEKVALLEEVSNLSAHRTEFERMQESGIFTSAELAEPANTGRQAAGDESKAKIAHDLHVQQVAKRKTVFGQWQQFVEQYGTDGDPEKVLADILSEERSAKETQVNCIANRKELTIKVKSLKWASIGAREKHNTLQSRIVAADNFRKQADSFDIWFKGENPEGLEPKVRNELKKSLEDRSRLENELSAIADKISAIKSFRARFGENADPGQWLKNRSDLHEKLRAKKDICFSGLNKLRIELEALEKFSVAPGQFAQDVQDNVGVEFVPLHAAIDSMNLGDTRKKDLLTLFSALLFAPVLRNTDIAETAARNIAAKNFEFPVFVAADLERFCRGENITTGNNTARSLFIGVKTQNVDCLLHPESLENRKKSLRTNITGFEHKHVLMSRGLERTSHTTDVAKLAERASQAIRLQAEEADKKTRGLLEGLSRTIEQLEIRASDAAVESIRAMIEYRKALNGATIEELKITLTAAEEILSKAVAEESFCEEALSKIILDLDAINEEVNKLGINNSQKAPVLKNISAFMADLEYGPVYMDNAKDQGEKLANAFNLASKKVGFRFEEAQLFLEMGAARHDEIRNRLEEISIRIPILDGLKLTLSPEIESMREVSHILTGDIAKVDGIARKMIKLYRKYRMQDLPVVDITGHEMYRSGRFLRNCETVSECIKRLIKLEDEIGAIEDRLEDVSRKLKDAESDYNTATKGYHERLDRVIDDDTLKLEEQELLLLQQAKSDPSRIKNLLNSAKRNYDKDFDANLAAKQHLDQEWSSISDWLSEFTRRLPSNLTLLKNRFAPKKDQNQNYLSAGFIVDAQCINHDDIEDVLREIVRDIEEYEGDRFIQKHNDIRRDAQNTFRKDIRNKFFKRVLLNPSIKVFIPSISRVKPILLDREIASSGQSVAISLLWIVKLADFVSERERARKTVSMSATARRKTRSIKSQFVFIDGAFSHLSDRALIDDVLGEIANTRGKFQLIVTGHEQNYKPNWKLFPTMLNGREVGGRYMYVDPEGQPIDPSKVGSHHGAMSMIRTSVINAEVSDGPISN